MLSSKWSRVVAIGVASVAAVGGVSYTRKTTASTVWKEQARIQALKPAYNNVPANYRGELFKPSFDFPNAPPPQGDQPWMKIDFKKEPEKYLRAVLDYCFEGNTECDFRVERNAVRAWYNAPWMAYRPTGREPIHGLTMERPATPGYIADCQKRWVQSWAVAFYNSHGGYTVGNFWAKPWAPKLENVIFPVGTVGFKLLFTQATEQEMPSLKGTKVWDAAIAVPDPPIPPGASDMEAFVILEKTLRARDRGPNPYPVRLLQVDVMVRDPRADIGWVFGTFAYHKDQPGNDSWRRLLPLCLQWGNDPDLTPEKYYEQGSRPKQTWTNPSMQQLGIMPKGRPYLGWLERANGPVDNFMSCCASCHSTASIPKPKKVRASTPSMVPDTMKWFRNIQAGEPFEEDGKSLDYSLQLDAGFTAFNQWRKDNPDTK